MAQYLQITFVFRGAVKAQELEPIFNVHALDWIRIAANSWVVWTRETPQQWVNLLKPQLGTSDSLFIFGINNNIRNGWAPKWAWDWFEKPRL